MRELLYTILEEWCNSGNITCSFCSGLVNKDNKAVCQIRARSKVTHKIVGSDFACENCKEKFENDELPKCEKCNRLKNQSNIDYPSGKYIFNCVRRKENTEEKELTALPHEERESTFYK